MVGWDGRTPAGGQTGDNQHTPGTWWGGAGGHLLAARREIISTRPLHGGVGAGGHLLAARRGIISTRPVHGGVGRADTCWRPDGK